MPKRATSAEKAYMDRVAQLGCVLCQELGQQPTGRITLHHPREGQGGAQRSPNWLVIPLCQDCHQGEHNGFHGRRAMWKLARWDEMDALAATIEAMV